MSALGLLTSMLGFGEASIALMIALYLAQDSFGTACNVTGDGVIALWPIASPKSGKPRVPRARRSLIAHAIKNGSHWLPFFMADI